MAENFEFKKSTEIPLQSVRGILYDLDELNILYNEDIEGEQLNTAIVSAMSESELAGHLKNMLREVQDGKQTPESLATHTMFQLMLRRAIEIEAAKDR